jgi:hypothetical protein
VREVWERECQDKEEEAEAATVKKKAMAQQKKETNGGRGKEKGPGQTNSKKTKGVEPPSHRL